MQKQLTSLKCPRCGNNKLRPVAVENALSRLDNETWVCSDCGSEEAFVDAGFVKRREWADIETYLTAVYNRKSGSPKQ